MQDRHDIGHPRVMGGAPYHRQVRTELCPEQRLYRSISGRAPSATVKKASPTRPVQRRKRHLRKWERHPVQGDPRDVADDREPTVPVTPRAKRGQTAQAGASRQEVAPEWPSPGGVIPVWVRLYMSGVRPSEPYRLPHDVPDCVTRIFRRPATSLVQRVRPPVGRAETRIAALEFATATKQTFAEALPTAAVDP
jgi:hypothetical protein